VVDDVLIGGWWTDEGRADDAMDWNTREKQIAGREVLATECPGLVERSDTLSEFVQSEDRAVVADSISLTAIYDLHFGFVNVQ
jgi:hypothetical protein